LIAEGARRPSRTVPCDFYKTALEASPCEDGHQWTTASKVLLDEPLLDVTQPAECQIEVRTAAHHGDSGRWFGLHAVGPPHPDVLVRRALAGPGEQESRIWSRKHSWSRESSSPQPHRQDIPRYLNQSGYSRKQPSAPDWSCPCGNSSWCGPVQPVSGNEIWDGRLRRGPRPRGRAVSGLQTSVLAIYLAFGP
jgi:hypothetical protein